MKIEILPQMFYILSRYNNLFLILVMRTLGKNGKNCRRREVINDVGRRAVEYNYIINDVLRWISPIDVKAGIGAFAQVVY